jgi:hypothetical protein
MAAATVTSRADRRPLEERLDPPTDRLVVMIRGKREARAAARSGVGAVGRR